MLAQHSRAWGVGVAALLLLGLLVRCWNFGEVVRSDGLLFWDNDSVRRLERLRTLDRETDYPVLERKDGFPQGSTSHWTQPMDRVIRALDVPAAVFFPGARTYEAGTLVAGPVLATCSLWLLLLGARRLCGDLGALCVGGFYALSYSLVNVSWLGNGDHQNLQHLALVGFVYGSLIALDGRARTGLAAAAGAGLGLAVWVSTESMLLFWLWCAAVLALALFGLPGRSFWRAQRAWCLGWLGTLCLGLASEQAVWANAEFDRISWFQLYQAAVFSGFVGIAGRARAATAGRVLACAGLAIALGLMPLALFGGLRDAIGAEFAAFSAVQNWVQGEVSEFRHLFVGPDLRFTFWPALHRFSFLLPVFPLALVAFAFDAERSRRLRVAGIVLASGTLALACWEVKLAHLFAPLYPLVLVLGADAIRRRRPPGQTLVALACVVLGLAAATSLPAHSKSAVAVAEASRGLALELRERARTAPGHSVLAHWQLGAHLMYYGDLPVVASGYHRNLEGILDAHRMLLSTPEDASDLRARLLARRVRWVVTWYDPSFLYYAPKTLGRESLVDPETLRLRPEAERSLFRRLDSGSVPGFELVSSGPRISALGELQPMYRVFEVRPERTDRMLR